MRSHALFTAIRKKIFEGMKKEKWSGKRVSNPQPSAWKADALAN
jgi:hypothetical protein